MAEDRKLSIDELKKVSGGWNFDDLTPEDQKKCMELWQDQFDAGGTNIEAECRRAWEEFDSYLCRKYGVDHDDQW